MSKKIFCPECGGSRFTCHASISAVLTTRPYIKGDLDYGLLEWSDIENIEYFQCQNCDFWFDGDEDQFLEELEEITQTTKD